MECSPGRGSMLKLAALFFAVAVSLCCVWSTWSCTGSASSSEEGAAAALRSDFRRRTSVSCAHQGYSGRGGAQWLRRRQLLRSSDRLGSYPPRCTSKCGECRPCYPVRVAVPPGVPVTTEYYPEAWRCKCGNRLYMP